MFAHTVQCADTWTDRGGGGGGGGLEHTLKWELNWSRERCWGGKNSRRRSSRRAFLSSATRSSRLSVARKSEKKSVTNARMVPCRHEMKWCHDIKGNPQRVSFCLATE